MFLLAALSLSLVGLGVLVSLGVVIVMLVDLVRSRER